MMNSQSLRPKSQACCDSALATIIYRLFPQESVNPSHFRARTYVFHQGAAVDAVYLVVSGSLVLERIDQEGRMAIFGVQKTGTLLSWQCHLDGGVHKNSCQALTRAELIVIPREKFELALHQNEDLLASLMQQVATQTSIYEDQIFRLSTLDVPERLYWTLLSLAGVSSAPCEEIEISTPLKKRDLAALVGTSPESISRSLNTLRKQKMASFTERNTYKLTGSRRVPADD